MCHLCFGVLGLIKVKGKIVHFLFVYFRSRVGGRREDGQENETSLLHKGKCESGHSAKVPLTRGSLDRHVVASDRIDPRLWNTTVCSSSLPCGSPTVTKSTQIIAAGLLAGLLCTEHC